MPCLPLALSFSFCLPSLARSPHSLTLSLTLRRSHDGRSALGSGADGRTERRTHARTDKLTAPSSSSALSLSRSFGSCSCVAPSLLAPFRQPDRHPASRHGDGRRWQLTDRRKRPMRRRPSVSARLTSSALSLLGPKRNRFAKEDVDHRISK